MNNATRSRRAIAADVQNLGGQLRSSRAFNKMPAEGPDVRRDSDHGDTNPDDDSTCRRDLAGQEELNQRFGREPDLNPAWPHQLSSLESPLPIRARGAHGKPMQIQYRLDRAFVLI
jgi:hypothetical protein